MRQIDPDAIKTLIRHNYATANVWLGGVQVMEGGLLMGQKGRDWWQEKIEKHIAWMRKHPKKVIEEALV